MKIQPLLDEATRQLILDVKRRHDAGAGYRRIAAALGLSKSTAARLCQKWTPELEGVVTEQPAEAVISYDFPGREEHDAAARDPGNPKSEIQNPKSSVRRSLDGYGRVIFIEKEGTNGKPEIWYDFDSKGRKRRKVRKGNTVIVTQCNESEIS